MALTFVNIHKCKRHRGWCSVKCGDDGVGRAFCECKLRWERVVGLIRFNEWGTQDLKIFLQSSGGGWGGRSHHGATVHIERDGATAHCHYGREGRKEWQVAPWRDPTHYEGDGSGLSLVRR